MSARGWVCARPSWAALEKAAREGQVLWGTENPLTWGPLQGASSLKGAWLAIGAPPGGVLGGEHGGHLRGVGRGVQSRRAGGCSWGRRARPPRSWGLCGWSVSGERRPRPEPAGCRGCGCGRAAGGLGIGETLLRTGPLAAAPLPQAGCRHRGGAPGTRPGGQRRAGVLPGLRLTPGSAGVLRPRAPRPWAPRPPPRPLRAGGLPRQAFEGLALPGVYRRETGRGEGGWGPGPTWPRPRFCKQCFSGPWPRWFPVAWLQPS